MSLRTLPWSTLSAALILRSGRSPSRRMGAASCFETPAARAPQHEAITFSTVMRGLDPRTHREKRLHLKRMDCRVKPGNDTAEDNGRRPEARPHPEEARSAVSKDEGGHLTSPSRRVRAASCFETPRCRAAPQHEAGPERFACGMNSAQIFAVCAPRVGTAR